MSKDSCARVSKMSDPPRPPPPRFTLRSIDSSFAFILRYEDCTIRYTDNKDKNLAFTIPEEEGGYVVDLPLGAPLAAQLFDPVEDVLAELLVLEGVLLELGVAFSDDAEQLQDGLTNVEIARKRE